MSLLNSNKLSLLEAYNEILNEAFASSDDVIKKVISERKLASFYYMGDEENAPGWRTVECVAFGQGMAKFPSTRNKKYIRAWQRKGKTLTIVPGWKFFRTDRIRNWNIGTQTFDVPRPKFNPNGDKTMWRVLAIAKFPSNPGNGPQQTPPPQPTKPIKPTGPVQKPVPPKTPRILKPTVKPTQKPSQPSPVTKPQPPKPQPKPIPAQQKPQPKKQAVPQDEPDYF